MYTCEAAEYVLGECLLIDSLSCEKNTQAFHRKLIKIVTNMYFNNHCNRKAEKQLEDKVKHFKKMKRLKEEEELLYLLDNFLSKNSEKNVRFYIFFYCL